MRPTLSAIQHLIRALQPSQSTEEEAGDAFGWAESVRAVDGRLAQLAGRLELGTFELQCLVLAVAMQVEPALSRLVCELSHRPIERGLTVGFLLEHFRSGARQRATGRRVFHPQSPLLRHGLLRLEEPVGHAGAGLVDKRLLAAPPLVAWLLEEPGLAQRPIESWFRMGLAAEELEAIRRLIDQHARYADLLDEWGLGVDLPAPRGLRILISGPPGTGKTLLARTIGSYLSRPVITVDAALPGMRPSLGDALVECRLVDAVLIVENADVIGGSLSNDLTSFGGLVVLTSRKADCGVDELEDLIVHHVRLGVPDESVRRQIWEAHLPPGVPVFDDVDLDHLASRYHFTGAAIRNAVAHAAGEALTAAPDAPGLSMARLEAGCTAQLPVPRDGLTLRGVSKHTLDDIVLGDAAKKTVAELIGACRNRATVLSRWGFGRRLATGKGMTVLFDGPPGTGKTFCAEIIASELNQPLQRVNVAQVVSKWAGETEKHIHRIFQAARASQGVLLFDEADSMFSARVTETRTAADRQGNMEVNLLLQEIERFDGVCILTTNLFGALDPALVRRIQFRVTFEEPTQAHRERIFEVLCPSEAPLAADVSFRDLAARFELTGAMIKNALLRAAYRACAAGHAIDQTVLVGACIDEYAAAGRLTRQLERVA